MQRPVSYFDLGKIPSPQTQTHNVYGTVRVVYIYNIYMYVQSMPVPLFQAGPPGYFVRIF